MQTETVTISTCTADKSETLDKLLHLGITAHTTCSDSTNVKSSEEHYEVFSVHESDIPSIPLPSTSTVTTSRQLTSQAQAEGLYEVFSVHKSDIPSIPLPNTSTATTSRQLTSKAKATETKSNVKLNTLVENPPEDIPLPSGIETDNTMTLQ